MRKALPKIAAVFLGCATSALAEIVVWQTATPLTPNAFIEGQGNGYTRLDLGCNTTVGECKWRLTTHAWIGNGTLASYSLWIRDPAGAGTQLTLSETSVAGAPFTNHILPPVENRPDGVLSALFLGFPQGGSPIPAGPTIYNLHSYVLTSSASIAPGTLTQLRGGSAGFFGFEPADPVDSRRVVAFGANPGFQIADSEWPNPVVHINYVPEPATVALLLAPALLLRRRRARPRSRRVH